MQLDNMKLYDEVVRKAHNDNIALSNAAERIGVSRMVLRNLMQGRDLRSNTLIKVLTWLETTDLKKFLKQ